MWFGFKLADVFSDFFLNYFIWFVKSCIIQNLTKTMWEVPRAKKPKDVLLYVCLGWLSLVSGEIYGTLHREVWDQFRGELMVGSVLVVRNVGLLSRGLSSRRHYLTITANNLVTIYSSSSGNTISSQELLLALMWQFFFVTVTFIVKWPLNERL